MFAPSIMDSPHDRYRDRLAALADEGALVPIVQTAGRRRSWWARNLVWRCTYGRFFPGQAPWATLVFAAAAPADAGQALCIVEAFDARPVSQNEQQVCVHDAAAGWLRLTRFPADAQLPFIATVLAEAGRSTVVRYRPGKRCTVRVNDDNGQPTAFAKLFPDDRGRRIYEEGVALWQASCAGTLEVAIPRPLRWDGSTNTLWHAPLAGHAVHKKLLGPDGPQLAEKMGRAVASIATSSLKPRATFDRDAQLQHTSKQAAELCRRVPCLARAIDALWEVLARSHAAASPRPLVPIHGAPHAHQWLEDGHHLGLVDFDGFTFGDPELDIATFMSEIDFEKRSSVSCAALNRAFLAGYEAVAGPVDRGLLNAYCAHKRLSKALKCACAIHPEGDVRAEQALGRALVCVLERLDEH